MTQVVPTQSTDRPTRESARFLDRLDSFDRQIVRFMIAWAPYAGPPDEECIPEFGLSAADLRERCVEIFTRGSSHRFVERDDHLIAHAMRTLDIWSSPVTASQPQQTTDLPRSADHCGPWQVHRGVRKWTGRRGSPEARVETLR